MDKCEIGTTNATMMVWHYLFDKTTIEPSYSND